MKINIWAIFRQHSLPKCCFEGFLSKKITQNHIFDGMFKTVFRQQMNALISKPDRGGVF